MTLIKRESLPHTRLQEKIEIWERKKEQIKMTRIAFALKHINEKCKPLNCVKGMFI